jgi:hypothetical protein
MQYLLNPKTRPYIGNSYHFSAIFRFERRFKPVEEIFALYPSRASGFTPFFLVESGLLIILVFYVVFFVLCMSLFCVLFLTLDESLDSSFVIARSDESLDCSFVIAPSVFYNVYLMQI